MGASPLAVLGTGLVTSVGLTAAASCAAIRAKLTNPTETRFIDSGGDWIMAHRVDLEEPWSGLTKLAKMACLAISDCLLDHPHEDYTRVPLLLCVAEKTRPGRPPDLDGLLFSEIQREVGIEFSAESLVLPQGRVGASVALLHARRLINDGTATSVLICATDSLLSWETLSIYEQTGRLLTAENSNGFVPGEGAGALLIGRVQKYPALCFEGLGFATETAAVNSEQPLRADGLVRAISAALSDGNCEIQQMDFRVTDLSGEQYYFKEAALAVSRTLRVRKEQFDVWHPAESIGETGAASGAAAIVVADAACRNGYAPGPKVLFHCGADAGQRSAAVFQYRAL